MTSTLIEQSLPGVISVEPFPVPSDSRRRRVVGVDVWVQTLPHIETVPNPTLRSVLDHLDCRIADVEACSDQAGERGRFRLRIVARHDDTHLTDKAIAEVLVALAERGHWSLVRKLEESDAIPAYAPTSTAPGPR